MKTTITTAVKSSAYNADMLNAIFTMNNWEETEITCPDGVTITVVPCSYSSVVNAETVCYFLIYADLPWMSADNLEDLAKEINNHAEALKELEADRKEIKDFFDKHEKEGWNSDAWDWYSDWHKDLYGFRPHGHVCGVYVEPYKGATIHTR